MGYLWPAWAPDGSRIATTIQHDIGGAHIGVINANGSGLVPLSTLAFTSGNARRTTSRWVKNDGSAQGTLISNGRNAASQP